MTEPCFTWLHISDLHFGKAQPSVAWTLALEDLLKSLRSAKRLKFHPIHAIFLTGDLAHSGKLDEYEPHARGFLRDVCEAAGVPVTRVFLVPGNHDVDRERIRPFHKLALVSPPGTDAARDGDALIRSDEVFSDGRTLELLGEKFHGFAGLFPDYFNAWRNGRYPYLVRAFTQDGLRIGVIGFNSASLVSGNDDKDVDRRCLLVGRRLRVAAFKELEKEKPDTVFVLMHHPLTWLQEWEEADMRAALAERKVVLLNGHLHTTAATDIITSEGNVVIAQAGALYENANYAKRFIVGQWWPYRGQLRFCPFIHRSARTGQQWFVEDEVFKTDDGIGEFVGPTATSIDKRLALIAEPVRLQTALFQNVPGCLARAVCVSLDGNAATLAQARSVKYTYETEHGTPHTCVNHIRAEKFAQTFPLSQSITVRAEVEFEDRSSRLIDGIHLSPT